MDFEEIGIKCIELAIQKLKGVKEVKALNNDINIQTDADLISNAAIVDYLKKSKVQCDIFSEEESFRDALHISVATIHNIDILVSWNFHHIVTYDTKRKVNAVNTLIGYRNIEVVSPLELGGGKYE